MNIPTKEPDPAQANLPLRPRRRDRFGDVVEEELLPAGVHGAERPAIDSGTIQARWRDVFRPFVASLSREQRRALEDVLEEGASR